MIKRFLTALILSLGLAKSASAAYVYGPFISTTTGKVTYGIAGTLYVAGSSLTLSTDTILMGGAGGNFSAGNITVSQNGSLYFVGQSTNLPGSTDVQDVRIFQAAANRLAVQGYSPGAVVAFDLYPTTQTKPGAGSAYTELTLHGFDSVNGSGTNYDQLSFLRISNANGGYYGFSMEAAGAGLYRDIRWSDDSGGSWNNAGDKVPPGDENYMTFISTRYNLTSKPIVLLFAHLRFDRDSQAGDPGTYFIARSTGFLQFNVPAYSTFTFSVAGSTWASLDAGVPNGTGGNFKVRGTVRPMAQAFTAPDTGKGIELYYDTGLESGVLDSNDRTGGLTRKPLFIEGTPITVASAGNVVEYINSGGDNVYGQGTYTSTFTILGNAFSVGGSTLVASGGKVGVGTNVLASTFTVAGTAQIGSGATVSTITSNGSIAMAAGASITMSGSGGFITSNSSVNAGSFFGDASHLSNVAKSLSVPQITVFTSGSGTYNVPTGASYLIVELVGGGGGGAGSGVGNGNGGNGGTTTFGSSFLTGNLGSGGVNNTAGGAGGTATGGDINVTGETGGSTSGISGADGANGGGTLLGLGGAGGFGGIAGYAGTGYGAGGGGTAFANTAAGGGGGGGGYCRKLVTSPSASYSYAVGAAGSAGAAGTSGQAGGVGTAGVVIVTAYFQ